MLKIFATTKQDCYNIQGDQGKRDACLKLADKLPNANEMSNNNLIVNILNWGYAAAGLVAVGFIIYGAWKYMSANGEPDRIKSASMIILYSIIGLVVVLLAAAITNFAITNVGSNI